MLETVAPLPVGFFTFVIPVLLHMCCYARYSEHFLLTEAHFVCRPENLKVKLAFPLLFATTYTTYETQYTSIRSGENRSCELI